MFDKILDNTDSLDDELNFERQRNPKQKLLNKHIDIQNDAQVKVKKVKERPYSQIEDQFVEQIKRATSRNISDDQTDVTNKKGKSFLNIFHNYRDRQETPKEANKEMPTLNTQEVIKNNHRSLLFSSITKSSSTLLALLKNSSQKTKTQQFLEKTILVQKVVPQEICQVCKVEDFVKIKMLGKGASGVVEKQLFTPLSQEIAMKKYLDDDKKEEFDSEVYIMKSKQSEFIPKLIYYHRDNLSIYMELGMITLDIYESYLRKNRLAFQENFGVWILKQLLVINKHMFDQGYHHSDIKPGNIIITFNEQQETKIKLIDLGAASTFPDDYWLQFTPLFQCPKLLKVLEGQKTLDKFQIFYAEFFASCRSIQLLTLTNHPKRSALFRLDALEEYLNDAHIKQKYEYLIVILKYIFLKNIPSLMENDFLFLQLLLNISINLKEYQADIENAYQQSNFIN